MKEREIYDKDEERRNEWKREEKPEIKKQKDRGIHRKRWDERKREKNVKKDTDDKEEKMN